LLSNEGFSAGMGVIRSTQLPDDEGLLTEAEIAGTT
jgi:hypothetical protein